MRCQLIGLSLWLLTSAAVWGAEPALPPTQSLLRPDQTGGWQLLVQCCECIPETKTRTITKKVPVQKTVTDTVNGEVVTKQVTQYQDVSETQAYTVCLTVYKTVAKHIAADSLKAYETDGRPIPTEKLRDRVGEQSLVLVSPNESKVAETYASLFQPGTVCIVFSSPQTSRVPTPPATLPSPSTAGEPQPAQGPPSIAGASPAAMSMYPNSPSPQFLMISRSDADKMTLRRLSESTSPVTVTKTVKTGSGIKQMPLQIVQSVQQREAFTVPNQHLHFALGNGGEVSLNRLRERLSRETAAVYFAEAGPVDPFWLQNLKSTTPVVTGPQLPTWNPSAPPSMMGPIAPAPMPPVEVVPSPTPSIPTPQIPIDTSSAQ